MSFRSYLPARWLCAACVAAMLSPGGASARDGDDAAYCERVRSRAGEDASLLLWPRIFVEGLRFPAGNAADLGPTIGEHAQVRVGLSVSPTDMYRGVLVRRAAVMGCELHEVSGALQHFVTRGTSARSLPALRAQAAYLEAHRDEWQAVFARTNERIGAGIVTAVEVQELRRLIGAIERKAETIRGEVERLEAAGPQERLQPIPVVADAFTDRAMRLERESSWVRALDAFQVKVSGGAIPSGQAVDWFAIVQVSYSLGGIAEGRERTRYLAARTSELKSASYELPGEAAATELALRAQARSAQRELRVIEAQLSSIATTLAAIERSEARGGDHLRATLAVERLALESDRIFLQTLVEGISSSAAPTQDGAVAGGD